MRPATPTDFERQASPSRPPCAFQMPDVPGKIAQMRTNTFCFLVGIFVTGLMPTAGAQNQNQQAAVVTVPVKPRLGQAGSQQELDDYNKMHNAYDPTLKKILIDDFVSKYPDSGLLAYVYQDGVYLGRQTNNIEMMADYGEKSLDMWPDNYTLLTELGSVYVQRDRVDQAEVKAKRALDLVAKADKPARMSDQQWIEGKKMLLASNYTTLGYVHLRRAQASQDPLVRRNEADSAISPFTTALEYHPIDDFSFYGIGFAYAILNDYPNAESNLAKAVAVNAIVVASARTLLEDIYRSQHMQSLDGIDQVIARARAELGIS